MGTLTPDEFAVLSNPYSASGYRNVYAERRPSGRVRYRARVLHAHKCWGSEAPNGVGLGFYRSLREALAAVVAFYRDRYGPDWTRTMRVHRANPWRTRRVKNGWWRADVWLKGKLLTLSYPDVPPETRAAIYPGCPRTGYLWPSRWAAREAVKEFILTACERHHTVRPRDLFWRPG